MANFQQQTLSNGLVVLMEQLPDVQSAAFSLMVPAGVIHEPEGASGTAAALCDLSVRGAGKRDSRELTARLDFLGVQRDEQVGWNFMTYSGATLADLLLPAIEVYADIVRRPLLPEDQLEPVLSGIEQSLMSVEDDPQRKLLIELRRRCYDSPWNRPVDGDLAELEKITLKRIQSLYQKCFRPNGSILCVAGAIDFDAVIKLAERLFADWKKGTEPAVVRKPVPRGYEHIMSESTQTHIGLAYDAVSTADPDYYAAWAAVSVLSGGSSSRLFTEVREKRGLCYSVYATLHSLLTEGRILAYAGTTVERAQETLDVMLAEMRRLGDGIDPAELVRCQARAKSSLIMQQESTMSRAGSLGRDWFHLGRVVPLEEVRQEVESLTVDRVVDYVRRHPVENLSILTVGPAPLKVA